MIIYLRLSKNEIKDLDRLSKVNGVSRHTQIQNMIREESKRQHLIEDDKKGLGKYDENDGYIKGKESCPYRRPSFPRSEKGTRFRICIFFSDIL